MFARDLDELDSKLTTAIAWGDALLKDPEPISRRVGSDATVRNIDECAFYGIASQGDEELIVFRTPTVFVIPSLRQRRLNRGHMLVLPVKHATRIVDLDRTLIGDLYLVAARVSSAVQQAFGASGMLLFQE